MAQKLTDHISSAYLDAAHRLYPKQTKRKIVAYVESYDDVAFWRNILDEFETDDFYFQVMLPSAQTLTKGKKTVLLNTLDTQKLGRSLIACVDSDLDFLLQDATPTSRKINQSPYIFQTYAYAIENYKCYAARLHAVCVEATLNDRQVVDYEVFMAKYSEVVYPLFLWLVYFYRQDNTHAFSLSDFSAVTHIRRISLRNPFETLEEVNRHVQRRLADLERRYSRDTQRVKDMVPELEKLGLKPENTYLYIQGHHLMDGVVLKLLVPVCSELRRERENSIKQLAEHHVQYDNELMAYQHSQEGVGQALKRNIDFHGLLQYDWLRQDLKHFADNMKGK